MLDSFNNFIILKHYLLVFLIKFYIIISHLSKNLPNYNISDTHLITNIILDNY